MSNRRNLRDESWVTYGGGSYDKLIDELVGLRNGLMSGVAHISIHDADEPEEDELIE